MARRYPPAVRDRAVKMVLAHVDEYESVFLAVKAVAPKVGVGVESLRRWVQLEVEKDTPAGQAAASAQAESKRVKDLERENRDLREANEILKAASIFFAGELDPRNSRK
jgi:transposase-like protein